MLAKTLHVSVASFLEVEDVIIVPNLVQWIVKCL